MSSILSKIWRRSDHQPPNKGKVEKPRPAPLGASQSFTTFFLISSACLAKPVSAQAQTLWELVVSPYNGRPPPRRYGRNWLPWTPLAALVGGVGDQDRPTPR